MIMGIMTLLQAVPKVWDLYNRYKALNLRMSFEDFIDNVGKHVTGLEKASNPEEKLDSAKDIVHDIHDIQ